jgi:hypothetical protein
MQMKRKTAKKGEHDAAKTPKGGNAQRDMGKGSGRGRRRRDAKDNSGALISLL